MSNTPEGRVKAKVRDIFKKYGVYYCHIPGTAFGKGGAPDYICCVNSIFLAVECKAGEGKQTELQKIEQYKIRKSSGRYALINERNLDVLESFIQELLNETRSN